MKLYLTIILVSVHFLLPAQINESITFENVLKKSMEVYQQSGDFEMDIDYKIYASQRRSDVSEAYSGRLIKHDDQYLNTIDQTAFVYLKEGFLKINHQQKALMYTPTVQSAESTPPIDLSSYVQSFDVKSRTEKNSLLYFELLPKKGKYGLGFSKIELYITKTDYSIEKQIMHYSAPMDFEAKDGTFYQDFPVMEVVFSSPNNTGDIDEEQFKLEHYLIVANNNVRLSESYAPYQLIDLSKN